MNPAICLKTSRRDPLCYFRPTALGHPLGATGSIRIATLVHGMRRRGQKYGMVTMCIGTGMGAAGIFEVV